jgi:hypothetical protein
MFLEYAGIDIEITAGLLFSFMTRSIKRLFVQSARAFCTAGIELFRFSAIKIMGVSFLSDDIFRAQASQEAADHRCCG